MPLSNRQYDDLLREYNEKQIRNQHILETRRKEIYAKVPRLKEIEKEISSTAVECATKMFDGDGNAIAELKERVGALKEEKLSIYDSLNLPHDYLQAPPYDCPDCKDTGYIGNKRCHCFMQRAIDIVYTQSNLKNVLGEENFDNFSYDFYPRDDTNATTGCSSYDSMHIFVDKAKAFIKDFDTKFDNLFLYGDTGVGKTFLSNCIAKELLDSSHSVIYLSAFQLFDIFRAANFNTENTTDLSEANVLNCDLLIIDDLGTELSNSFTNSQLFLCLNERILHKKSTIISTNLSLENFSNIYSERILSRISSNYTMFRLTGVDIRIRKKIANNAK
ncbi:MAG: ATP-binding protein [Lachnospiraceae bacterium]|nr:ATP-binding protein [Lachnospiraceae bacterium]